MAYTLTATYDNPPSAVLTLTGDSAFSTTPRYRFKIYSDSAGTQLVTSSGWITLSEASATITYTVASINSGTYYVTAESDDPQTFVSLQEVVLADNTPRTATQSQWEDLTARIKAKSDVNITMTTTDPGEGSALAANNYIAVYGGDPIIMDYSTTEINTGAKWINGSAIYKKTVDTGALPNAATKTVAHSISNLGKVIRIEGYATESSLFLPLPGVFSLANQSVQVQVTSTDITLYSAADHSNYTESYVTLYYTKSS